MKKLLITIIIINLILSGFAQKYATIEKYRNTSVYIRDGNFQQIKNYVNEGWSVKPPPGFNFSWLTAAVITDRPEMVQYFIDNGADVNFENGAVNEKVTALGFAMGNDNPVRMVKILLKNGANPNYIEHSGFSMLNKSFGTKNNTVISMMINTGADVNKNMYIEGINYSSLGLLLAMHYDYTAVKLMIDAGANVNSKIKYSAKNITMSVLDFAEYINKNSDIVSLLKSKGAKNYYNANSSSSSKYLSLNDIFSYLGTSNKTSGSKDYSSSYNESTYKNSSLEVIGFYLNKSNFCNGECDRYIISFNKEVKGGGSSWDLKSNQIYVYKKHSGGWYSSSSNFYNTSYIGNDKSKVMEWALKKYSN